MSDQADIFGHPVTDLGKARESFIGAAGLRFLGPHPPVFSQRECNFSHGHCQLGHGHALPHCVPDPDGLGSYLMVDENGLILREI